MTIVKDWITKAGTRALILLHDEAGHHCGYVEVSKESFLFGKAYSASVIVPSEIKLEKYLVEEVAKNIFICHIDCLFNVHGGITFSGYLQEAGDETSWWFGYDCGHAGDSNKYSHQEGDTFKDEEYCIQECETLAEQLKNYKEIA